jgi:hypothetical protein
MLRPQEPFADRLVDEGDEAVVVPGRVDQSDWFRVFAELAPGPNLEELL